MSFSHKWIPCLRLEVAGRKIAKLYRKLGFEVLLNTSLPVFVQNGCCSGAWRFATHIIPLHPVGTAGTGAAAAAAAAAAAGATA